MADKRIAQLTGLKVIALLGIFCWHSLPQTGLPDIGARLTELFFVVSGFLVGSRHHGKFSYSLKACWDYVWPKVKKFYPVYLVGLALGVLVYALNASWYFNFSTIMPIIWALLLQQAWIPAIAMIYNGAAWFISAWLFCIFCAPCIQALLNKAQEIGGNRRGALGLFISILLVRIFLELCQADSPSVYLYSLHTTPFIRLLEFSLAYIMGVWFSRFETHKSSRLTSTILEFVASAVVIACTSCFNSLWPRWAFVLLWIFFVPILARGGGLIAWLLSRNFLTICGSVEMEFYLLHQAVIQNIWILFATFSLGGYKKAALTAFVLAVVLAVLCNQIFRRLKSVGPNLI